MRLIRWRRSSLLAVSFVVAAGVSALYALALAGSTAAALPPGCTQSGATVTCTFSAGSEGAFAVPAGVSSLHVVVVGGGGGSSLNASGGPGAQVTSDLNVTSGSNLFIEVGIGGGAGDQAHGTTGNGGGASDVRTCSIADSSCPAVGSANDPRLVVAGGGGGAGGVGGGRRGGAGGTGVNIPCNPGMDGTPTSDSDQGKGGGCTSGGAGGGGAATAGTASSGGAGGFRGGGGGAGYFGGGGGASGNVVNGGGGGGGSSFGPTGSVFATATTGPSVTISYTVPASALAATLVSDSTGKGPGKALPEKAAAIQTAVTAGQTATACAGIADYLGLVNAQTGKHLTASDATTLTNDATNLSTALGCTSVPEGLGTAGPPGAGMTPGRHAAVPTKRHASRCRHGSRGRSCVRPAHRRLSTRRPPQRR